MQNLDVEKTGMEKVYNIDGIATVIRHLKGNLAKGYIINKDMTTSPCYVAKAGDYFAHGETAKEAMQDARNKEVNNMDIENKIKEFKKKFKNDQTYPSHDFFDWHGILTGSCKFGRDAFVKENSIDLEKKYTVKEFVDMCENTYGYEIIVKLLED